MVIVRCTASLLKRLRQPLADGESTGALGDWYAKVVCTRPRVLVLCVNARSLLSVVVPLAPTSSFLDRFGVAACRRIGQIEAAPDRRQVELDALASLGVARTRDRSVLSSMNHFAYAASTWLLEQPDGDLEDLGRWLCDTPCFPLRTTWPWMEARSLLGGPV